MSLTVFVVSLELLTNCPIELSVTIFEIMLVASVIFGLVFDLQVLVVFLARIDHPGTSAMFHSFLEKTTVDVAIRPFVLAVPVHLSIRVLTNIDVAIRKKVRTTAMSKAVFPLTLISITVGPSLSSIALSPVIEPLTDIVLSGSRTTSSPHSETLTTALSPLAIINGSIMTLIRSLAMKQSSLERPLVCIVILKQLIPAAMLHAILPTAFINWRVHFLFLLKDLFILIVFTAPSIDHNTLTMPLTLLIDLSKISHLLSISFVFLDCKGRTGLLQCIKIELI